MGPLQVNQAVHVQIGEEPFVDPWVLTVHVFKGRRLKEPRVFTCTCENTEIAGKPALIFEWQDPQPPAVYLETLLGAINVFLQRKFPEFNFGLVPGEQTDPAKLS